VDIKNIRDSLYYNSSTICLPSSVEEPDVDKEDKKGTKIDTVLLYGKDAKKKKKGYYHSSLLYL